MLFKYFFYINDLFNVIMTFLHILRTVICALLAQAEGSLLPDMT